MCSQSSAVFLLTVLHIVMSLICSLINPAHAAQKAKGKLHYYLGNLLQPILIARYVPLYIPDPHGYDIFGICFIEVIGSCRYTLF